MEIKLKKYENYIQNSKKHYVGYHSFHVLLDTNFGESSSTLMFATSLQSMAAKKW
jgi:hypothetical protein